MIEHHPIPLGHRLHPMRSQYLTASDVPAVAGLDPWKSPLRVYAEKTGQIDGIPDNPQLRRGRWLEAAAIEALHEELPDWRIVRPHTFIADDMTRLGCTPDALTEDPETGGLVNLQIKTTSPGAFEKWQGIAPIGYQLQVLTEGLLLDAERNVLVVLVVDAWSATLEAFDIPRHPAAEARIRDIAKQFWENIVSGRRPAPDYSRDADTIAALFPKPDPGLPPLDLSGDNRLLQILPRREELKDGIDGYRKELDGLDAEIKYKLGDAETATLPGWKISWKEEHRKAYEVAESTRRVLRITEIKEKAA